MSDLSELSPALINHFKFWIKVANYYDKTCTRDALIVFAQHTRRFAIEDLAFAFEKYASNPKEKFMPRPGQLIGILEPESDLDIEAKEIAGRVVKAVADHGWTNSSKARADIGEAGWSAVVAYGGWPYICENLGTKISMGQFQAQIRDHAKACLENRKASETLTQLEHNKSERLNSIVLKLAQEKGMGE